MRPATRVHIVQRDRSGGPAPRRWPWAVLLAIVWLASLGAVWWVATRSAAPRLADAETALQQARQTQAQQRRQIEQLQQRQVNLAMSDKISRAANTEVQTSLAERDEQIAALRADVAFYERLVGSTAQRKGLNAHSVQFSPEAGGTWSYSVVLTQNLNRGAISQGQLRFAVEGVRAGKLTTVSWNELHQKNEAAGQPYSFRYFQQLDGSVMLPKDFTPQRVKITLSGDGAPINQTFDWKVAGNGAGE
ncbi:DUF6776 family protein [Xanthomonas maliensis]|uniref:DUF6776 family protein n=1 Tax=Xanthomonas maliensis TaxID=1321368 RepID=UPI0004CF63EC|nr:DUF6776 family protein [Xanthomonas maliensis]KAB7771082.1 hypothetical protein CKY51_03420 [Xanthomonas maliensis]